jgi:hypothetical protein
MSITDRAAFSGLVRWKFSSTYFLNGARPACARWWRAISPARGFCSTGATWPITPGQMSDAWLAFARSGSPNTKSLPDWPAYTSEKRATMLFDVANRVVEDPNAEVRKILESWLLTNTTLLRLFSLEILGEA